ncbi:MAG TPA: hypothetical protein VKB34_14865 [Povalibacter sp.]|nr:hypothetical protein [Povalibacter sp.]
MNIRLYNFLEDNSGRIALSLQERLASVHRPVSPPVADALVEAFIDASVTDMTDAFDEMLAPQEDGAGDPKARELDIFEASLACVSIVRRLLEEEYSSRKAAEAAGLLDEALTKVETTAAKVAGRILDRAAAANAR